MFRPGPREVVIFSTSPATAIRTGSLAGLARVRRRDGGLRDELKLESSRCVPRLARTISRPNEPSPRESVKCRSSPRSRTLSPATARRAGAGARGRLSRDVAEQVFDTQRHRQPGHTHGEFTPRRAADARCGGDARSAAQRRGQAGDAAPPVLAEDYLDINGTPAARRAAETPRRALGRLRHRRDELVLPRPPALLGRGPAAQRGRRADLPAGLARRAEGRARLEGARTQENSAIVFGACRVNMETARFGKNDFEESGARASSALVPQPLERPDHRAHHHAAPRLTTAEYLVAPSARCTSPLSSTVMSVSSESLRRGRGPRLRRSAAGRRGYPGYMYIDLSTIYERAGRVNGRERLGQLSIRTMRQRRHHARDPDLEEAPRRASARRQRARARAPRERASSASSPSSHAAHTHAIRAHTHTSRRRISFSRPAAAQQGDLPAHQRAAVALAPLMKSAIGEGMTREDHGAVSNQLYASYPCGKDADIDECRWRRGGADCAEMTTSTDVPREVRVQVIAQTPYQNRRPSSRSSTA